MKRAAFHILGLGVIVAVALAILHFYYRGQIFHPSEERPDLAKADFPVEAVTVETAGGLRLNAWYHAPESGEAVVLYLHGNSSNVDGYVRGYRPLVKAGYGVLALDYRGYGGNPGRPTDEGLLADGRAALQFLRGQGIPGERIALYGYSLGTGVAVPLAAEAEVAAVILAAPFASIAAMGYRSYPNWFVDLLLADRFDSIVVIDRVAEPILIIHGDADRTVPPVQSAMLVDAANGNARRILFDGASHGWDLFEPHGNRAILAFLSEIFRSPMRESRQTD